MKKISRYALSAFVLAVSMVGCKSFTKGYDVSPIAPSTAPATATFTGAQVSFDLFMEGFSSQMAALWGQEATGAISQYVGYYNYTTSSQDYANDWGIAYENVLYDMRLVQSEAPAAGYTNLRGAARIVEGIQMGTIADLWGDVPYSQALKPDSILTPKFDAQSAVYTAVQATFDAGIADLTANGGALPVDILSSQGNSAAWVRLAHTMKARFLMHVARHGGYASNAAILAQVITQCQSGILDTAGTEDVMFQHGNGVWNGDMNMWCSFLTVDRAGYIDASSTFVIPMMVMAALDGKTDYTGQLAYYFNGAQNDFNTSSTGAYSATSPFPLARASETHLLWAEAAARTGDATTALAQLNLARAYNNNVFGDHSALFVSTDAAVSTPAALLQTILNTEYVSLMGQVEVLSFLRRIDYGIQYSDSASATRALAPVFGSQFPQRFYYPNNEVNSNPNTPVQGSGALFQKTWANQ